MLVCRFCELNDGVMVRLRIFVRFVHRWHRATVWHQSAVRFTSDCRVGVGVAVAGAVELGACCV